VFTRLLKPGIHYVSLPLQSSPKSDLCTLLTQAVDWAEAHPREVATIARAGLALARDTMQMEAIYWYMSVALAASSRLLAYRPARAVGPSNSTRVPTEPRRFRQWLRNDSATYPVTAQMSEEDWTAVVLNHNYSAMGAGFAAKARALEAEVRRLVEAQRARERERKKQGRKPSVILSDLVKRQKASVRTHAGTVNAGSLEPIARPPPLPPLPTSSREGRAVKGAREARGRGRLAGRGRGRMRWMQGQGQGRARHT
jgi:hypothetical protein